MAESENISPSRITEDGFIDDEDVSMRSAGSFSSLTNMDVDRISYDGDMNEMEVSFEEVSNEPDNFSLTTDNEVETNSDTESNQSQRGYDDENWGTDIFQPNTSIRVTVSLFNNRVFDFDVTVELRFLRTEGQ